MAVLVFCWLLGLVLNIAGSGFLEREPLCGGGGTGANFIDYKIYFYISLSEGAYFISSISKFFKKHSNHFTKYSINLLKNNKYIT